MAVIKLAGIGDRRLGKVVSGFEGGAGIVIASWICERKTCQGIGAIARVERHCQAAMSLSIQAMSLVFTPQFDSETGFFC